MENEIIDELGDISKWSEVRVHLWFKENGYHVSENFTNGISSINGKRLLQLSETDLRKPPFSMSNDSEIDHLVTCIELLRKEQLDRCMKNLGKNGICNNSKSNGHSVTKNGGMFNHNHSYRHTDNGEQFTSITVPLISVLNETSEDASTRHIVVSLERSPVQSNGSKFPNSCIMEDNNSEDNLSASNSLSSLNNVSNEQYPVEKFKSFVSMIYLFLGFLSSVATLQLVHERVPPMEENPPLPDVFFDLVPQRIEWAFNVCEINGMILVFLSLTIFAFHKHRFILIRRVFFILGTLYLYRSLTMYVTTLPVPGLHFRCAPKVHGKIWVMMQRAFGLLSGGGLTVTGSHHLCGDYLFSGHTLILVVMYLTVSEYTPKRWWWLHWICWLLAATGIICILLAHDHYTIDVVIAYLLATRLFWTYHTMANTLSLKNSTNSNFLSRNWWFPIFQYFECNVWGGGPVPRQYEWPLPWPRRFKHVTIRRSPIKGV